VNEQTGSADRARSIFSELLPSLMVVERGVENRSTRGHVTLDARDQNVKI
jgi:hypothetical protein